MSNNQFLRVLGIALIGLSWSGACSTALQADTFELKDGRRIIGKLLARRTEEKQIVVEVDSGIAMLIDEADLKNPPKQAAPDKPSTGDKTSVLDQEYQSRLRSMADTVQGHLEMAGWCDKVGLRSLKIAHFERILDLDADHEVARAALGFRKDRGQWVRVETVMGEQRGKVKVKGKWQYPEVVALEEEKAKAKEGVAALRESIRQWQRNVQTGNAKAADSLTKLQSLEDPYAVAVIRELLYPNNVQRMTKNALPETLRQLYVDILGKLKTGDAAQLLIQISMTDSDSQIRDACYQHLRAFAAREAAAAYVGYLRKGTPPETIELAGSGLAAMQQPMSILPLIDNLVTVHTTIIPGSNATSPSFSSDPNGGGTSFGSAPSKRIDNKYNSPAILSALTQLTGVNFQYDQEAWMRWYTSKYFPVASDLRRDP